MQKTMQKHAAVFRTEDSLKEGVNYMHDIYSSFEDIGISDRSMIWNSDLVEALELVYRGELERAKIVEELEMLMLTIDEMFEDGHILAFDATSIAERVLMREVNEPAPVKASAKESLFGRALKNAKQAISKTISARK